MRARYGVVNRAGKFQFDEVPAGDYTISVEASRGHSGTPGLPAPGLRDGLTATSLTDGRGRADASRLPDSGGLDGGHRLSVRSSVIAPVLVSNVMLRPLVVTIANCAPSTSAGSDATQRTCETELATFFTLFTRRATS